jgi:excinuclease UvrABC nuclease subunit
MNKKNKEEKIIYSIKTMLKTISEENYKYIDKLVDLLLSNYIPFDDNLKNLPTNGGVYRIFRPLSDWQESLYIGETNNLRKRIYENLLKGNLSSHTFIKKLSESGNFSDEESIKDYLKNCCCLQYIEIENEKERKFFEHFSISILKPKYND